MLEEEILNNQDITRTDIVGIDEVGYGSWAGPLYICALKFTKSHNNMFCDSKAISHKKRVELYNLVQGIAIWNIGVASVEEINELGLAAAYKNALKRACEKFASDVDNKFIIDGRAQKPIEYSSKIINFIGMIKGDSKIQAISAASIVAKVERDGLMDQLDEQYQQYHWAQNKGYGTKAHIQALQMHGFSSQHRTSYNLAKYL